MPIRPQGAIDLNTNKPLSIDRVCETFAPVLKKRGAKKAIVFGSYARGDADQYSDLDLIIIAETDKKFFKRHEGFKGVYDV